MTAARKTGALEARATLLGWLGVRQLKLHPARAIVTLLGIVLGTSLFSATHKLNETTYEYFRDSMAAVTGKADLSVSTDDAGFDEDTIPRLEALPEVQTVAPVLEMRAWSPKLPEPILVMGVDVLQDDQVRSYGSAPGKRMGDGLEFVSHLDSVMLTDAYAAAHGLALGSKLPVQTPTGARELVVRSLLGDNVFARSYGGAIAVMDIDALRVLSGRLRKVDRADLVLKPGASPQEARAKVSALLGPRFRVERPEARSEHIERMLRLFQATLSLLSALSLLVGIFLVYHSAGVTVYQRTAEIASIRILGGSRAQVGRAFAAEFLVLALIGGAISGFVSHRLAELLIAQASQATASQYVFAVQIRHVTLTAGDFAGCILVSAVAMLAAIAIPMRRLMGLSPLDATRTAGSEAGGGARRENARTAALGAATIALGLLPLVPGFLIGRMAPIQIASSCLLLAGGTLLGLAAFRALAGARAASADGLGAPSLYLALRNMGRLSRRMQAGVCYLMLALSLVCAIGVVHKSFETTFSDWAERMFHWELLIGSHPQAVSYQNPPIPSSLRAKLVGVAGVEDVMGMRVIQAQADGHPVGIKAYDRPRDLDGAAKALFEFVEGSPEAAPRELFDGKGDAVLVSRNLAERHGKHAGDTIVLSTDRGDRPLRIAGVIEELASGELVVMDRRAYRELFRDDLVNRFQVKLAPGADASAMQRTLAARLDPASGVSVLRTSEIKARMLGAVRRTFVFLATIQSAALLVALLGIFNTLLVGVMDRTTELGFLRALGTTRAQIGLLVLSESGLLGICVGALATALGIALSWVFIHFQLRQGFGWKIGWTLPWESWGWTLALSLAAGILGGLIPAWKASRVQVLEAIRYE